MAGRGSGVALSATVENVKYSLVRLQLHSVLVASFCTKFKHV